MSTDPFLHALGELDALADAIGLELGIPPQTGHAEHRTAEQCIDDIDRLLPQILSGAAGEGEPPALV